MLGIKPFWSYYGGKWRAAPRYPAPLYDTIIEPFAGAAGYSLRYPDRNVVLIERYAVVAGIWRYLIAVRESELMAVPATDHVDDLPSWVPEDARNLVGFCLNDATTAPRKSLSSGRRAGRESGSTQAGWSAGRKLRIAGQLSAIRHWKIIEGDYRDAPDVEATWFVDPPYESSAGRYYKHNTVDFPALGAWCRNRKGQTVVCENVGANWLPFREMYESPLSVNGKRSAEAVWTNDGVAGAMRRNADAQAALRTAMESL